MKKPESIATLPTPTKQFENPQDFLEFGQRYREQLERLRPLLKNSIGKQSEDSQWDPLNIHESLLRFWETIARRPHYLFDLQIEYWQKMALLADATQKKLRGETADVIIESERGDRRFRDPLWNDNALFDFMKQSYLLAGQIIQRSIEINNDMDKADKQKLSFVSRQVMDGLAPTNFAFSNPEVINATIASHGGNLLRGMQNLIEDLERGQGHLDIAKTNYSSYEVGKNLAVTSGAVIFRNDLIELIQYTPSTKDVLKTPVLIVPPWINKYYILDMRPDNSFVKWAVDQGQTVFMISWVNPSKKLASKNFGDYMEDGIFAALDAIKKATGEDSVHTVGYCIGGTLLATGLGYLAAQKNDKRIKSATFLTTLIDFTDSGDLKLFTDDAQLKKLDKKMSEKGMLEGRELRNTFSMLRANDLIWSFVINNYLLGKEPFPFDLLYWNDDSTNMPASMHSFYLKNMYRDNLLCKAGGIKIKNVPIDLRLVKTPVYFLSTKEDHIAPWRATFEGMHLFSGEKHFTLSASGHVAGVVNPPASKKYHYWTSEEIDDRDFADEWLAKTTQYDGSWWDHWSNWIKGLAPKTVKARDIKNPLCPAPGTYVLAKAK